MAAREVAAVARRRPARARSLVVFLMVVEESESEVGMAADAAFEHVFQGKM
jgi:hypothetical protein